MNACKATEFNNYHVPASDSTRIAILALSTRFTCLCNETSDVGYRKLALDIGDPELITRVNAAVDALYAVRERVREVAREQRP